MATKHDGHIYMYETPIVGNIVVYISEPINDDEILRGL